MSRLTKALQQAKLLIKDEVVSKSVVLRNLTQKGFKFDLPNDSDYIELSWETPEFLIGLYFYIDFDDETITEVEVNYSTTVFDNDYSITVSEDKVVDLVTKLAQLKPVTLTYTCEISVLPLDLFGEMYDYASSVEDFETQVQEPADLVSFSEGNNVRILSSKIQKK